MSSNGSPCWSVAKVPDPMNKLNKPGSRKTRKWRKLWNAVGKEQRFKRVKVVVMIGDNQGREIATGVVEGKSDAMTTPMFTFTLSEQTAEDVDMDDTETVVAPSATPAELLPEMLPGVAEVMNSKIGASWYQRYRSGDFTDDMILRRCGAEVLEAFQACAATEEEEAELAQKAGVHMDAELADVVDDGKTELCGPAGEGSGEARGEGGREAAVDGHAAWLLQKVRQAISHQGKKLGQRNPARARGHNVGLTVRDPCQHGGERCFVCGMTWQSVQGYQDQAETPLAWLQWKACPVMWPVVVWQQ